jgi:hypothetical protein
MSRQRVCALALLSLLAVHAAAASARNLGFDDFKKVTALF